MTNVEFYEFLNSAFKEVSLNHKENDEMKKQIVFSALFNDYSNDENGNEDYNQDIEMWNNTVETPSEFLVGKKYIVIKDSVLALIKASIGAGIIDVIIKSIGNTTIPVLIGTCAFELYELYSSASELDDGDFCVYYQAMTHYAVRKKEGFTIDELKSWLPKKFNDSCNMHNSTWVCDYYDIDTDSCSFCDDNKIKTALRSLESKNLINKKKRNNIYHYRFKW